MKIAMQYTVLERLLTNTKEKINLNELLILTIGTSTIVGNVTKINAKELEMQLKLATIAEKDQRIAISKKIGNSWRLYAFGISK